MKRKAKLKKHGIISIAYNVVLFVIIVLLLINIILDIITSIKDTSNIYSVFSRNFWDIFIILFGLKVLIILFKTIKDNINNFQFALRFLDEHEYCNECVVSYSVNKYIEILDNDVMILSYSPYLIRLEDCLDAEILEPEIKPLFKRESYLFRFINSGGDIMKIELPKLSQKDGSYQRLVGYFTNLRKNQV